MKRILLGALLCAAMLFGGAAPAVAAQAGTLDGLRIGHVPRGLGTASDFAYEYNDVTFVSRVWESQNATGWQVDLTVDVLRGDRLATPAALHDWLIDYQDRPAGEAQYRRTRVHGHAAWIGRDEIFWLLRPGVAVMIRLDTERWNHCELRQTAVSVRHA